MWHREPWPNRYSGDFFVDGNLFVSQQLQVTQPAFLNGGAQITGDTVIDGNTFLNGQLVADMVYVDKGNRGTVQFDDPANNRTTEGLQCLPTMQNGWTTPAAGSREQLTFARYPGGWVECYGVVGNTSTAQRANGKSICHLNGTAFSQTFKPVAGVFTVVADGRGNGSGNAPVVQISYDGNVYCFNFETTTNGNLDYRFHATYNVFTRPGYYENTGGGP